MPEKQDKKKKDVSQLSPEEQEKLLDELIKEEKRKKLEKIKKHYATKEILETDFYEEGIDVTFRTSPKTRRTLLIRPLTQQEYRDIIDISVILTEYEKKKSALTKDEAKEMFKLIDKLAKIAANICKDKNLDYSFWRNKVPLPILINFLLAAMDASQSILLPEIDLESFR